MYAFDIQKQAMENTLKRCKGYDNLTFYLTGHQYIGELIHEPIDCAVFNFGYLPYSDMNCITKPDTSLIAIEAAYTLLKQNGIMLLAVYLGHAGGIEEHEAIYHWIIEKQQRINVKSYTQRPGAPILYLIKKTEVNP